MADTKQSITPREQDFAEWYQDVIAAADLAEHADGVRGAMIIKPYGYALWERIQQVLNQKIKETGHQNVYFPLFIPKSNLSREAEHVEGFAKETAVVTHHRLIANPDGDGLVVDPAAKLTEELIVRPTSETAIHSAFSRWITSWRDLPVLINQWANVVRMELRPRMFLRTTEFLWQEGHTAHATNDEATAEVRKMLAMYQEFAEDYMAVAVVPGQKSESEKFAGAEYTTTIEALMQDGKALQAGTSHNLGQNFSKVFNVMYSDEENNRQYAWLTSWGVSTRLIGGLIMSHSDDKGLVLPPELAPIQVVILPIAKDEASRAIVLTEIEKFKAQLASLDIRVSVDDREHLSLGAKHFEWEKKGVPIRIEVGQRDIDAGAVPVKWRVDVHEEKKSTSFDASGAAATADSLGDIQDHMLEASQSRLGNQTFETTTYEDFKTQIENGGFFKASWCGDAVCEEQIKNDTKATIRCIPFDQPTSFGDCLVCDKPGTSQVLLARAY